MSNVVCDYRLTRQTRIAKLADDVSDAEPCWEQEVDNIKPRVRCTCGEWVPLSRAHHVHVSGNVTPAFEHECGWDVWLMLADYNGGEFLPQQESNSLGEDFVEALNAQ